MSNLTYLIGAGASVGAIPIVDKLLDALKEFRDDISKYKFDKTESLFEQNIMFTTSSEEEVNSLFEDIDWLINEASEFTTIDTLAKKLYLTKDFKRYESLKRVLLLFFNYIQSTNSLDKRYDHFFATLLSSENDNLIFPKNINIVTWNYDFQFELSFSKFYSKNIEDLYNCESGLYFPSNSDQAISNEILRIFKLNGSAVCKNESSKLCLLMEEFIHKDSESAKNILYKNIKLKNKIYTNLIKFSWEDSLESQYLKNIKDIISRSSQLVIIGYSFPQFNRSIDSLILSSYNQSNKIYIQDPNPSNILDTVSLLTNRHKDTINIIEDKSRFYLPHDFIPRYIA